MEQQKFEPLNGANSNGVEALDSSIEQQNSESSNDGMEQQKSESLNGANSSGVEALDSSIEQQNSESSNAGTSSHVATQMDKCKEVLWLFKDRKIKEAIGLLGSISHLDEWVVSTYVELLQDCGKVKAVTEGKELHALALKHGFLSNGFIASTLISTYCKLGMVPEAQKIFDGMRTRSALSWNALISGYAKHGYHKEAVRLYHSMKEEGFQLDSVTYILMLNSCASKGDIQLGKQIHADARKYDYECKLWVSTALLNMYVKCGDLEDARRVFDNMTNRNVITWTSMISGYAKSGNGLEALNLYQQMKRAGVKATEITFLFLLKACASLAEIEQGKQIHADLIKSGLSLNAFLGTALIDMYSKCGDMGKAQEVFDKIPTPNVVSFAAMISGHCKNGNNKEAIRCYMQMKQQGFRPNGVTIASVLHACANAESLEEGQQIHADAVRYGFSSDVRVTAALVNMYSQCHRLQVARELFNRMSHQSVVSWTAMIAAYAKNAAGEEAFKLYDQMKKENIKPDASTFVFVLHACATTRNLEMGKQIHAEVLEAGLESHIAVGSALVDMYSKCGSLADSRLVFDRMPTKNISTWTSMIAGYVKHENSEEAFQLYRQMKLEGLKPDAWVFVCVLNACVQTGSLEYGKEVHEDIRKAGYETDATVKNSLSIMYSKCESPEARQAQQALQQA
ncbi:hypothetical protein O6H91_04G038400 [Diphasiastrum complanatum]|nr:hypothetical protein O6H91_04G038400 [Diphasiastrum complanatum]